MSNWLLKTEPETFSWDQQVERGCQGRTLERRAQFHCPPASQGDEGGRACFFYHTARRNRSSASSRSSANPIRIQPTRRGKFLAVDVKAIEPLPNPVTLAAIKAEPRLKDMALVKYSRLSVQPVTAAEWKIVRHMGGKKGIKSLPRRQRGHRRGH